MMTQRALELLRTEYPCRQMFPENGFLSVGKTTRALFLRIKVPTAFSDPEGFVQPGDGL